jgi:hypothetical protein
MSFRLIRCKRSVVKGAEYEYLPIVRSYREGGKVKQQIIGSLGAGTGCWPPGSWTPC